MSRRAAAHKISHCDTYGIEKAFSEKKTEKALFFGDVCKGKTLLLRGRRGRGFLENQNNPESGVSAKDERNKARSIFLERVFFCLFLQRRSLLQFGERVGGSCGERGGKG